MASDMYETEMDTIKSVMPMFSTASDEDIISNCEVAKLTTYGDNLNLFKGTAKTIYTDMCGVWESIGETVNTELIDTLFNTKYLDNLSADFDANETTSVKVAVNEDNKDEVLDAEALLQKSASVNFVINTAKFTDSAEATEKLNDFIEIAKVLDGTIIEIAGNTDPNPNSDPEDKANKLLLIK